jgi:hypothetical protein
MTGRPKACALRSRFMGQKKTPRTGVAHAVHRRPRTVRCCDCRCNRGTKHPDHEAAEPVAFRGLEAIAPILQLANRDNAVGDWRLAPAQANPTPSAASYLRRPGDSKFRAFKLDPLRIEDGSIARERRSAPGCSRHSAYRQSSDAEPSGGPPARFGEDESWRTNAGSGRPPISPSRRRCGWRQPCGRPPDRVARAKPWSWLRWSPRTRSKEVTRDRTKVRVGAQSRHQGRQSVGISMANGHIEGKYRRKPTGRRVGMKRQRSGCATPKDLSQHLGSPRGESNP